MAGLRIRQCLSHRWVQRSLGTCRAVQNHLPRKRLRFDKDLANRIARIRTFFQSFVGDIHRRNYRSAPLDTFLRIDMEPKSRDPSPLCRRLRKIAYDNGTRSYRFLILYRCHLKHREQLLFIQSQHALIYLVYSSIMLILYRF